MFAFLFGLAWLILTPVCVWLLFGRDHRAALRTAAVVVLGALQAGTLAVGFASRSPGASTAGSSRSPAAPATPGGAVAQDAEPCSGRVLTPEAVRLRDSGAALNVTVFWKADASRCETAAVTLRPSGRRIGILLREGAPTRSGASARGDAAARGREETHTAPIRVAHGMASTRLRLTPRRHSHRRYVAVDISTGEQIPRLRSGDHP